MNRRSSRPTPRFSFRFKIFLPVLILLPLLFGFDPFTRADTVTAGSKADAGKETKLKTKIPPGSVDPATLRNQHKHFRVRKARMEKAERIRKLFSEAAMTYPPKEIFLRAFKAEGVLELWARSDLREPFRRIRVYTICASSGTPGPKRRQGDEQVPEGFYHIDRFNPASSFHLSLGLNYPNESDRILSDRRHPGGDIFIHGSCVTIGCMPITDTQIRELYLIALDTHTHQRRIPVHVFPRRMDAEGMRVLSEFAGENEALLSFWKNIEEGYRYFERKRTLPKFRVDKQGRYVFSEN